MKLTILGMAGSFPSPESPASSYLVQTTDADGRTWSLLMDLGSGALGALQREVNPFEVDAVAISHLHPDHFADLCGFYVYLKYHPVCGSERGTGRPATPVYAPAVAEQRLAEAYGLEAHESMSGQLDFHAWEPGTTTTVGPFEIEPVAVDHPIPAYGVRVTGPSSMRPGERATLAYTGDTDSCDGLVELARSVDLLLAEAAFVEGRDSVRGVHLTGLRAGEAATQAGAGRLLLTHIPSWNDPEVTVAEARSSFSGPVEVVAPGASYLV